jgi:hypothetical protein
MRGVAMLIEFRVSNFRSFNEEQVLSLVAARRDAKHPDSLIQCNGFDLLKSTVVYGANASGKSNLIKAFWIMKSIVCGSATKSNLGDPIPGIFPFKLNLETTKKPTRFEVTLLVDDICFLYGFSATRERVHDEFLRVRAPNAKERERTWFRRTLDADGKTSWAFGGLFEKETKELKENLQSTRDNCLLLSYAAQFNVKCLSRLFLWFRNNFRVEDLSDPPDSLQQETASAAKENNAFHDRIIGLVRDADLNIHDVHFQRNDEIDMGIKEVFKAFSSPLEIKTLHRAEGSDDFVVFDMKQDESKGTNRFFALVGPFLEALEKGAVVVVDELECSMHPLLTRKLIELFQDPEQNKKGAQLIFATHDVSLMDPYLFRRDQIWIVEKRQNGASVLFSLYDFETEERPRNTEAFQRNYLAGRYGGVPSFGPFFENLEGR